MATTYQFDDDEIACLQAACKVFNRFTDSSYTLQKYIKFVNQDAIAKELCAARQAQKIARSHKIQHVFKDAVYAH